MVKKESTEWKETLQSQGVPEFRIKHMSHSKTFIKIYYKMHCSCFNPQMPLVKY